MRLELVQGSAIENTLNTYFAFTVESSTAYYCSAYMTLSSGNLSAMLKESCLFV